MARFDGTSGDDVLRGGSGDDELFGYEGNDYLEGESGDDSLYGHDGNDSLGGGGGNDQIRGGPGDDVIDGDDGQDDLWGGEGNDWLNPGDTDRWESVYGSTGNDTIVYSDVQIGYHTLDYSSLDAGIHARINGVSNTGSVDKGPAGTDTIVDVANPLNAGWTTGGLEFYATHFDDVIDLTLDDEQWMSVVAGAGDDTINISTGDSSERGLVSLDFVWWDAENGIDVDLDAGKAYDDGYGDVDTINGTVWEVRGTDFADRMVGSDNNESFVGRLGDDTIDGGGGFDRLRFDRFGVGDVEVDLDAGTATGTWNDAAFSYTISNIEHVRGGAGNDALRGGAGDDRFDGRGGDDTLIGAAGNDNLRGDDGADMLFGDAGRDWLWGGAGADSLDGGAGEDWLNYWGSDAGVSVNLATEVVSGGHAEGDTINGFENVWGSSHDDTLVGDGGDNILHGGEGGDRLHGGAGNDLVSYWLSGASVNVNLATGVVAGGGDAEGDTISGFEGVWGTSYDDTLIGNDGDGEFWGGAGRDYLDGGGGDDTLDYDGSYAGVSVNLAGGRVSGGDGTGDTISGFEHVWGSSHADTLIGDGGGNELWGNAGNDRVYGREGDDTLGGSDGNDLLRGGAGDDRLEGGEGNDRLYGDQDHDTLDGGSGNDRLFGGTGDDVLHGGTGNDVHWGGTGNDLLEGGEGNDRFSAQHGDDTVRGGGR